MDPARDLAPLLERLRTTSDEDEQDDLIDVIKEFGEAEAAIPAAVKAYLREAAPPVLLAVARSKAPVSVRGDALRVLRDLNVADSVLDEAIAIASADTSVKFSGELLADWKKSRQPPVYAAPGSPEKEQAALEFLRQRRERVSSYNLGQAARHADTEMVTALLDAGIDVDVYLPGGGDTPLEYTVGWGCIDNDVDAQLAMLDLLIQRGADVKRKDGNGNTILMGALDCPVPVVEKLIAAGASVDAANVQSFTALHLAFAKGKWDVAEFLVKHGARLSKKEIDKLFFEKPTEPDKLALIRRATAK